MFKKVTDKFRSKTQENIPADQDRFKWRIKRNRQLKTIRFVSILLLAAFVGIIVYISYVNREYTDYEILTDNDRRDAEDAMYEPYDGNVIKYSRDGAEAFDSDNNAIWNITFEMQNPKIATCKGYAAIGDFKGTRIYAIDSRGEVGQIETKLPVSSFCISSQGVVAAVLEDEDITKINLYSSAGELLAQMKCTMAKSGYPADISLSPDGMKLCVSYVRVDAGSLKSSVAFYNFDEVGQNEIDNYVSGYDYPDVIIPKVKFINNDTAFAVGDGRLVFYKGSQKPVSIKDVFLTDRVHSVYYGEKNVVLTYRDTSDDGGTGRIDIYDDKGEVILTEQTPVEYTDIAVKNDGIIIYNDKSCEMYDYHGRNKFKGDFKEAMRLVVPSKSSIRWTLVNRGTVQGVRLN